MAMTGEVILSDDEQAAFAELTSGYDDPRGGIAVGGLTAVMARVQNEALAQEEQLAAGDNELNMAATSFQSAR